MDSTFAPQTDDVSSSMTVRAEALIRAAIAISPEEIVPSNFLLALMPAHLKQVIAEPTESTPVAPSQNVLPDGWSQFEDFLTHAPSLSTDVSDADAPHVFHSHDNSSETSPRVESQMSGTNEISFINFLAASSCLVTGEL